MSPRITVYVVSHNYGRFLCEAIESVLRQTFEDWELLLIDDNSTDDTGEIINRYKGCEKIRVFKTSGIGLPAVNNLALRESRGEYIIRLDGDDVFDENILLVLSNRLDRGKELTLVFPDYYLVDESGEVFSHERRRKLNTSDHLLDVPPNGACTMIRVNILKELGGYREDLGAQDGLDLWVKLKDQYLTANISLPLFFYRRHGKNLTEQPLRIVNARREIKKSSTLDKLKNMRPIIAVIPCRKNYDFIPNLWNQKIDGRSLLERDIDTCLGSSIIDKVVVTCDNSAARKTVNRFDRSRVHFVHRDERKTLRSSPIAETLREVSLEFDPEFRGTIVLRYVQTPFVSTGTIEEAVTSVAVSDAESSCAVEELRSRVYRRNSFGLYQVNGDAENMIGGDLYYRDSTTCVALRNQNLRNGSIHGARMAGFVVSAAESFFISSAHELTVARALAANIDEGMGVQ